MSERQCKRCGEPMPPEGDLGGRCPRCMLSVGLAADDGEATMEGLLDTSPGVVSHVEGGLGLGTRSADTGSSA